jgi:PTH1 family peptidyl-tRNA hydrolase
MRLIVGLGNPGTDYAATRHNIGFRCVNLLARRHGIRFSIRRSKASIAIGEVEGRQVALAKPRTYMNNSGEGVRYLLERLSATPADLVAIYDDMDLPLGSIRVRAGGGAGGHRGMASIIQATGTQAIPRIRVGIGRPPEGMDPIDYVLSPFLPEEEALAKQATARAAEAAVLLLREGIEAAMQRFNARETAEG